MYRIDNWINEGSGWIVEFIESQYINISTYRPLSGSSYIKLPVELKKFKKRSNQHPKWDHKNVIMSEKEEEEFQLSNACWICEKLIDDDNEKVRVHSHVTGKFRRAAHWSCNKNLQVTKKVPVMFQNLRGYDSHLIFDKFNKFDVKIEVIPNR